MATLLISHPSFLEHDTGPYHPERPDRLRAILAALDDASFASLVRMEAPAASLEELTRVHPQDYVEAILGIRPGPGEHVQVDGDTVMSRGSGGGAARGRRRRGRRRSRPAGQGADRLRRGPSAGHHARPASRAASACSTTSRWARATRNGSTASSASPSSTSTSITARARSRRRVRSQPVLRLDASIPVDPHRRKRNRRGPQCRQRAGAGCPAARRCAPPGAAHPAALEAFAPELVMVSAGFDAHAVDPLAQLEVETEDFVWLTEELLAVADRHAEGRLVSVLEGGWRPRRAGRIGRHARAGPDEGVMRGLPCL
jgi:hypothetical protein